MKTLGERKLSDNQKERDRIPAVVYHAAEGLTHPSLPRDGVGILPAGQLITEVWNSLVFSSCFQMNVISQLSFSLCFPQMFPVL